MKTLKNTPRINEKYAPITALTEGGKVVVIGGVWKWGPLFSQQHQKSSKKTA